MKISDKIDNEMLTLTA